MQTARKPGTFHTLLGPRFDVEGQLCSLLWAVLRFSSGESTSMKAAPVAAMVDPLVSLAYSPALLCIWVLTTGLLALFLCAGG
jgi:hypothetical protein